MNLAFHHFRKEFRYLRLRWFGFLAVLILEMAVNLEWLLPMQAGVPSPGWLGYLPAVVMLSGLSLLLSCPEDQPGSDRSFISTRPMPLRAYWLSRIAVWLLLILLPTVLVNGLYLVLSDRPVADVLRGMGERFALGAGYSAWLLTMLLLWQRKEIWKVSLILVPAYFLTSKLLEVVSVKFDMINYTQSCSMLAQGLVVFVLLTGFLVWQHLVKGYSLRKRITLTVLAGVLSLFLSRISIFDDSTPVSRNPDLVQKLAPDLKVGFDLAEANFEGEERSFGPLLRGPQVVVQTGQNIHVTLRPESSLFQQAGYTSRATNTERKFYRFWESPGQEVFRGDLILAGFFPKGTLFMHFDENMPKWSLNEQPLTKIATFAAPHPDFDEPLRVETDFLVDWYQRDIPLEMPVVDGSASECDELRWKILRVSPEEGPKPGALTLFIHQESRNHWNSQNGHAILLHLPEQRIVRLEPVKQIVVSQRGARTGWQHSQLEVTWNHVFNHEDGEPTGVDLTTARLTLLRSRFLGQSQANWKSPEFTPADIPSSWGNELNWYPERNLYRGREKKAFQERIATITPPTEESTKEEARRYAYDLFTAASLTNAVYTKPAHPEIVRAFEPLGEYHLPLLLELRSHNWPGWTNQPPNSLLERYVTADQREALVERAPENGMLADLVLKKGWSEEAKRHKPKLLASPVLTPGAKTLLLAWKEDPEVAERLIEAGPHDFDGSIINALDEMPETRPQIENLVEEQFKDTLLLMSSTVASRKVERAAEFGTVEAFELCLRWLGLEGDIERSYSPHVSLLNADGTDFWRNDPMPDHVRRSYFRGLEVGDFEYVAEKRAWRFLKP